MRLYNYYTEITSAGSTPVNGQPVPGKTDYSPDNITQTVVDNLYNRPANFQFSLQTTNTGTGTTHSCKLDVTATALNAFTSTKGIKLHVALIENEIDYKKVYGEDPSNGQIIHNFLVRKMLPDGNGTSIGNQTNGKENKYTFNYTNDDKYQNYEKMRVVIFVQNDDSKEVLDCYVSTTHPFQGGVAIEDNTINKKFSEFFINRISSNTISFYTPEDNNYELLLYSSDGKVIKSIVTDSFKKGINSVSWSANTVAKGVYFIELRTGSMKADRKFVVY